MRRMGLTPEDINATDKFVDNFLKAGEHIKESAIDGQLLADITETMGKSARELIPAFKDGFAELTEEAEKLGIIIPTESILRMAEASDRLKVIWLEVRAVLAEVFVAVQNAFGYMQDYVAGLFTGVVALFKGGGFKGFGEAFKEEWGRHAREREEQEVERKSKTNATVLTLQEEDDSKAREKEQRATQRKEEAEAKRLARQQEKEAAAAAKLAAFKDPYITDSLAKIGGFGQLANTKMEGLAERTAEATEKIAKNTEPSTIDEGDYAL
jgi:hypothetical protein